jgi:hypothetical protein
VAPSVSSSLPSRCWSTSATVRTASFGQARHGAAPRTFPRKLSAWRVPTKYIPARVTPGPVSTTISARPVGQRFAGRERPAPRDLGSRLEHLTIRRSPLHRCPFGKRDDTRGRLLSRMWPTGKRNRLLAEASFERQASTAKSGLADDIVVSQQRAFGLPAPRIVQGSEQQAPKTSLLSRCVSAAAGGACLLLHRSHPSFASFEGRIQKM